MGGSIGSTLGNVVRGATDVMTFGTAEIGGLSKKLGNLASGKGVGGGNYSAPVVGGTQSPMQALTMSGGAPLLTNVALGANPQTAVMGYFGASGDYGSWFNNLDSADQQAVQGVVDQLTQVQTNTNLKNQAVTQLTSDFPNIMAATIPQYSAMADAATQGMMTQALNAISAKQAAGGSFSSGATAEASANAGAAIGLQKLQYGTTMALTDFDQQLSAASALQSFQQKMLGQGATQGFNAAQNSLQRNAGLATTQANLQNSANNNNTAASNSMYGAIGSVAGTAIGSLFGPAGAAVGGAVGGSGFGMYGNAPRLNASAPSSAMGGPVG